MIKVIVIILQSISCQFQYFSNALCNLSGQGCDSNLKAMTVSFPVYHLTLTGNQAMIIALSFEVAFFVLLVAVVKFSFKPKDNFEKINILDLASNFKP